MPLLLMTPGAELLVDHWRADHDWAAHYGIPAHVTVRAPFLDPQLWPGSPPAQLQTLLPLELTLTRFDDRPGALVVLVEPDEHLRQLTDAVGALWPELPPHKGDRADFAYHMTVVRTNDSGIRSRARNEIAPQLPFRVQGTALWAAHGSAESGAQHSVVVAATADGTGSH
jgi:hypothetical protein